MRRLRDVRLNATITPGGLVRSYDLRYEATVDGRRVRVERTVRFVGVNETTVERPSWGGTVLNGSGD